MVELKHDIKVSGDSVDIDIVFFREGSDFLRLEYKNLHFLNFNAPLKGEVDSMAYLNDNETPLYTLNVYGLGCNGLRTKLLSHSVTDDDTDEAFPGLFDFLNFVDYWVENKELYKPHSIHESNDSVGVLSKSNMYLDDTYLLSKNMRGETSIHIVVNDSHDVFGLTRKSVVIPELSDENLREIVNIFMDAILKICN